MHHIYFAINAYHSDLASQNRLYSTWEICFTASFLSGTSAKHRFGRRCSKLDDERWTSIASNGLRANGDGTSATNLCHASFPASRDVYLTNIYTMVYLRKMCMSTNSNGYGAPPATPYTYIPWYICDILEYILTSTAMEHTA